MYLKKKKTCAFLEYLLQIILILNLKIQQKKNKNSFSQVHKQNIRLVYSKRFLLGFNLPRE